MEYTNAQGCVWSFPEKN